MPFCVFMTRLLNISKTLLVALLFALAFTSCEKEVITVPGTDGPTFEQRDGEEGDIEAPLDGDDGIDSVHDGDEDEDFDNEDDPKGEGNGDDSSRG